MIAIVVFFFALVSGIAFVAEKEPVWLRIVGAVILVLLASYILFIVTMAIGMSNDEF